MNTSPLQQRLEEIEKDLEGIRVREDTVYVDYEAIMALHASKDLLLALAKEVPQLVEALEFYANRNHFEFEGKNSEPISIDSGEVARKALAHYDSTISPLLND